jgi:hypothetical protein
LKHEEGLSSNKPTVDRENIVRKQQTKELTFLFELPTAIKMG